MAAKIRGITIEFTGDASGLNKSLQQVSKALNDTTKQLKDVDKLLKLDPGNTELLAQKQKLLGEAVAGTKTKLDEQKKALAALQAAEGGDKATKGQMALKREIIETEAALGDAEKAMKDFGSVGKQQAEAVAGKMAAVGDAMKSTGETLTKTVTAGVAALGAASVAAFNEVDKGADTIVAKTGASGAALKSLTDTMNNLATTIPTDFETAAAAVGEVNTRFNVTGTELEKLSEQFIKFSKLNNTDVSGSIDQVQKVMTAYGLSIKDVPALLDTLNATGQKTGISMDQLAGALVTNATSLQEMGMNAADAADFLGSLETSGVDSSAALAGLKKALANATKEGKTLPQAMSEIEQKIAGAQTSTEGLAAASELFGTKAGPAMYSALKAGTLSLSEFGASLTDNAGNINSTFEEALDPVDSFQTTLNQLKIVGAEVGAAILENVAPAIQAIAEKIKAVAEWWGGLAPEVQQAILVAAAVAAAIGPVLIALGSLITAIQAIVAIAPVVGSAITIMTGPVGAVIAAIAAAIAIGIALYKNWDVIKEKAVAVWGSIKEYFANTWNAVKETAATVWAGIKAAILAPIEAVKATLKTIFDVMVAITLARFNLIKKAITDPIGLAKEIFTKAIGTIKGLLTGDWSLPHIKLPHFSITGKFSLNPPQIPHLSVEWYKKAYSDGVMFTQPTVLPTASGLKGFGDGNGAEIVIGKAALTNMIQSAIGGQVIQVNSYTTLDGKVLTKTVGRYAAAGLTGSSLARGNN